jgi:hypothetical protein
MIFVACKPALVQSRGRREIEPVDVGYRLAFGPPADLEPVNRFHGPAGHETTHSADEAIFPPHEEGLKPILVPMEPLVRQRGSIMWMLISLLYRACCRARLLEMRRYRATTA